MLLSCIPNAGTASSNLLLLASISPSSFSISSVLLSLFWLCWCIIAAIEKLVILLKAAAVDMVEAHLAASNLPFKTELGDVDGSGELEGLTDLGCDEDEDIINSFK